MTTSKPDLVIHPSVLAGIYLDDLIDYCSKLSIPMLAIMNSWDNPSTKHGAVGMPDTLLVWGRQTKAHAEKYMKMPSKRVIPFGAAQFDVYQTVSQNTPEEFRIKHGLPGDCKVLLYAGSSKGTAEIEHLTYLDELIQRGGLGAIKVIYRPHPWGGGGSGGAKILDQRWQNVVIESSMMAYLERVKDGEDPVHLADYSHTHNVLSNVDFLISPLSTIILEAALHGKPAMCFLPLEETQADHFQVARELPHFEEMFAMDIFPKAFDMNELEAGIKKLIAQADESDITSRLADAAAYFVEPFEHSWRDRFPEYCANFVKNQTKDSWEKS